MKLTKLVPVLALCASAVACQSSESPPPLTPAGPPPGHWYGPPTAPAPRPPTLGEALGAFGVLIAAQIPPPQTWTLPWLWPQGQPPASQPPSQPPIDPSSPWEDQVLQLTNARRAAGAVCGNQSFAPAAPLAPNPALTAAARGHSRDMAERGFFEHTNPDGRTPADRAVAAGFQSRYVGENIAAGQRGPTEVVQAWMDSPGHCQNIMDPHYRVLGVGYFFSPQSSHGHYWTQDFGG
jgi:uncharacterized protein YkwD